MAEKTKKEILTSSKAPKALGPYSQGINSGGFLFLSGQLGLDPESGEFVEGGVEAQTRQALLNIKNVLQEAGCDLSDVVKTSVFLSDIADFPKMNAVYAEFFKKNHPARSTMQVSALPKLGLVEIDVIAKV